MSAPNVLERSTTRARYAAHGFAMQIQLEGVEAVRAKTPRSTWHALVKQLKAEGRWPLAPGPADDFGTLCPARFGQALETPKVSSVALCPGDTEDPDRKPESRNGGGRAAAPLSAPAPTSQPEPQNSQVAGARSGVGAGAGGSARELAPAPAASPEAIRGARAPTPPGTAPEGAP